MTKRSTVDRMPNARQNQQTMSAERSEGAKPLRWIGRSLDDLRAFPVAVRGVMGFALRQAQHGGRHRDAKILKGFGGAGVLEIVDDHEGDTYRAVYTVRFPGVVYVLHAFQKKSKSGIKTPPADMDLIRRRLKDAEDDHAQRQADEPRRG